MENLRNFEDLVGKICTSVVASDVEVTFTLENGDRYHLYHGQDCCETVYLDDVCGDLKDLVGSVITQAEEVSNEPPKLGYNPESCTWTFYRLATEKGFVTLRWYGESNGYYSESVDWEKLTC